jgi:phage shock protein A
MGLFDRLSRVIKSNSNAALDKLEDPKKQVDQLILEMEEALRKARGETQRGMAAEKLALGRVAEADKQHAAWGQRAELAVKSGDDDLAREALAAQGEAEKRAQQTRQEHAAAHAAAEAQRAALTKLEERLRAVKQRKGTLQAKLALGKNAALSTSALDDFDRMSDRIDSDEGAAGAADEVEAALSGADGGNGSGELGTKTRDAAVETRLARLGSGEMDDRLAALKKKMEPK